MKKQVIFFLISVLSLGLFSCDDDPKKEILEDVNLVETLKKYTWKNEEVSDWNDTSYGGYYEESSTKLFFMDNNVGYEYQVVWNYDSDLENTKDTWFNEFTYSVSGNKVTIRYKSSGYSTTYTYMYGLLQWAGDSYFEPNAWTQNDRDLIKSKTEESTPQTAKCGANLTYTYNKQTKELVISGSGDMYDYGTNNQPWNGLDIRSLTIKEGVTSVGKNFLNGVDNSIEDLSLPSSLKRIGNNAFSGMYIDYVSIPASVVEIGAYAFSGCEYLTSIYIPSSSKLQTIGDYAFINCSKLKETYFTLPASVKTVGDFAFNSATIKNITLNEGLETIGEYVFCGVTGDVKIPNSVKKIGKVAFDGSFSKIVLGTGIQELKNVSFFSTASSGRVYVNQGTPLSVSGEFIGSNSVTGETHKNWTLYVPTGCKSAYSKKSPWSKFKAIYEDSTLEGGNSGGSDDDDDNNDEGSDYTGTVNGHKYVDLGLSVKWATCNVGADSPEEYGDYFAWGETVTKSSYSSSNSVTYGLSTSELKSRGIIGSDGNLTASYDVATVKWGSRWRMPTKKEMNELVEDCTWTWMTQDGVKGRKVTGPNGNSIFLPAAGYRYGTVLYYAGSYGFYWSATPDGYSYLAFSLYFDSDNCYWGLDGRSYCHAVRPVSE